MSYSSSSDQGPKKRLKAIRYWTRTRVREVPLTHTCVCFKTWILQRVVSGCLFFLLMCEGDLAPERSQKEKRFEYTQHPPAVKHLRWHFELPGGQTLPGQKDTRQNPAGLQVLTEAGVPPPPPPPHPWDGRVWMGCMYCKHIHKQAWRQPFNLSFTPGFSVCACPPSQLQTWTLGISQTPVRRPGGPVVVRGSAAEWSLHPAGTRVRINQRVSLHEQIVERPWSVAVCTTGQCKQN